MAFVSAAAAKRVAERPSSDPRLGFTAFIMTYVAASATDRQRVKWIVVGLIAGFGGSVGFDVIRWRARVDGLLREMAAAGLAL